jgi:ABC-type transport system substrate-binding protein/class 3 adenylate cyclase
VSDGTDAPAEIRTFLIADVRGYTHFTQTHGDEAAARLAARFAEVVREQVEARGGTVVELRGDEALCVFGSPRSALRAAVELQRRCAEEMRADPSLPLAVGIGIDAGEAIPVAGGYRGGALNLAARLCSIAKRGEVLVSDGIAHLARRTDELVYIDRGLQQFKGFDEQVHVLQVSFELDMPEESMVAPASRWTPLRLASIAVAGIAALAAVVALAATEIGGGSHPKTLGTNVVGILDPSGQIIGHVRLPGRPTGLATGDGSVWATVAERSEVVKIDPQARIVVDTIATGPGSGPTGIAVGGGGVWAALGGSGKVLWINANDPTAINTIQVGQGPGPIAFGEGAAWVVNTTDGTMRRIDGTTFKVSKPISVGRLPGAVTVGGGWVWVTDTGSSSVIKIDPHSLAVVGRPRVGNDPAAVTFGGGRLWVANAGDGTVTRLDPASDQGQPVAVGRTPSGIAYGEGGTWVTVAGPPAVERIDASLHVSSTTVDSTPLAPVVADGQIWVAALAPPRTHRGGTLVAAFSSDNFGPGYSPFDPAVAPYPDHWQMLAMTNDGLVTYQRVGGAAGLQVVPDLAVAMPTVGDGGRSYTFQLRRGIRYSNGRPVRASDFRYALERQLSPAALSRGGGGYYQDVMFSSIVGYAACRNHPATCSFRTGIQTDDRTGTITIHLTQPDATLPQKLATTFGDLVPPGSPAPDSGKPVPATGPYMVSAVTHHGYGGVLLVRNPSFHQWSADAQPAGYPDRIRWVFTKDTAAELSAVEQGRADVMVDGPPPDRFSELTTRYATLAHVYASLSTTYLALNTRVAPFDSLAARQAVNLAVDRRQVVAHLGGPLSQTPTCQVLPPGMFGYAPYCPYTANPTAAGTWSGPDLARARQLVDASGTRGERVVVWAWGGSHSLPALPYLVHALDQLGYRASSHVTSPDGAGFGEANAATSDSRRHIAASLGGWAADYPNPIDYLDLLLTCHAFTPNSPSNLNTSEFCNSASDALVRSAEAVQTRDPALGSRLWQKADREVVDQAPWVPLVNGIGIDVVSARVGNYQRNSEWSVLLDQLWVR